MIIYIYLLRDPITNEIRYIGKTKDLKQRLINHINNAKLKKFNRHIYNWILTLLNQNLKPLIELVEECNLDNWSEREKYWIKYYKELGNNLCNHSIGGEGTKNGCQLQYRGEKAVNAVLTENQALEIINLLGLGYSNSAIGKELGINNQLVNGIKNRGNWSYLGKPLKTKIIFRIPPNIIKSILIDRNNQLTYKELSLKHKISKTTIQKIIKYYDKSTESN